MNSEPQFSVKELSFSAENIPLLEKDYYTKEFWPVVYILSDGNVKEAYVGETTDANARLSTHLKNNHKKKLTSVHLISSKKFNKSVTLDFESNLIQYMSGDGQYKLLNGNLGLTNHNYYQKWDIYRQIFHSVWNTLRTKGIAKHSIEYIDNSDLFKYSPYKSLTKEQVKGLKMILNSIIDRDSKNVIIEGGAGTGKTILAVFLFKMLNSDGEDFNFEEFGDEEKVFIELINIIKEIYPKPKMGLVVPMSSFRSTLKKVFSNVGGLTASMVIGPAGVTRERYDILLVDESHRLRRRINLGAYFGAFDNACERLGFDKHKHNELDWVIKQSNKAVLFYDENQSIKPSDVQKEDFDRLKKNKETQIEKLESQFRVKGGNSYVNFTDKLLNTCLPEDHDKFIPKNYELVLFDSLDKMIKTVREKNEEGGLSRLVAGYSWEWVSKRNPEAFDIEIEGIELRWNTTNDDWINSKNSIKEVGCIHTTQGYDLNYTGVIFGNEISYDPDSDQIFIKEENYYDRYGKQSIEDPEKLKNYIINIYKTILLRGIKGTYVYACDDNLRKYLSKYIPKNELEEKVETKILTHHKVKPFENSVPLYSLKVAAGEFGDFQRVEDHDWVKVSNRYRNLKDLFACEVIGESMNKVIPNGSLCLFRKYAGGSRNGKIVLVEHSEFIDADYGSCYTVKEYHSKKRHEGDEWAHDLILLKPLSYIKNYNTIELSDDGERSFNVIGIFECVL